MYHGSTFRFCFQVLLWRSLAFSCLQWLCFQGRGSKAFHKNIVFYKPSARDEWTDGVRKIKFLFSRPSVQRQLNKVYPEDLPDIVNKFGHGALVGLHVKQDGSKSQELQEQPRRVRLPWQSLTRTPARLWGNLQPPPLIPRSVRGLTPSECRICGCNSHFRESSRFF